MRLIIFSLCNLLVVALFLYSKLAPVKAQLSGNYLRAFTTFENLIGPVLKLFRGFMKPIQVGAGVAIDLSQTLLLILLLTIMKLSAPAVYSRW